MIILDLDDTLINHSFAQRAAAAKFGEKYAHLIPDYDSSSFVTKWKSVAEYHFQSFLDRKISYQEQRRRRLRTILADQKLTDKQADEMFATVVFHYEAAWQLFPDVNDFINANKQHRLGMITDGSKWHQMKKLERLNINHHFEFILTAEDTGLCKPDPRLFIWACEIAKVKTEHSYYIGDNLNKDALGASAAGLKGVWLNRDDKNVCQYKPDVKTTSRFKTIRSLSEFDFYQ